MKKLCTVLLFLSLVFASVSSFVYAESDGLARFRVNDRLLTDMSVQELYEVEDAIVSALSVVFNQDPQYTASGERIGVYVANPNSMKFHYPYCYSALQIGPGREFYFCSPSDLLAKKYKPCGMCNPHVNTK